MNLLARVSNITRPLASKGCGERETTLIVRWKRRHSFKNGLHSGREDSEWDWTRLNRSNKNEAVKTHWYCSCEDGSFHCCFLHFHIVCSKQIFIACNKTKIYKFCTLLNVKLIVLNGLFDRSAHNTGRYYESFLKSKYEIWTYFLLNMDFFMNHYFRSRCYIMKALWRLFKTQKWISALAKAYWAARVI